MGRGSLGRLAALLAAAAALFAAFPSTATAQPAESSVVASAFLNSAGLPLMMPTNQTTNGRRWYFEVPEKPVGLLVMLHRCGRNAEDWWPPSSVCPQCIGMPESVSISRQALARGYALLAINSANRTIGALGRCWSWGTDSKDVKDIVTAFRRQQNLDKLPLFFTGCSSGGSLALRLPGIMDIDGIMPVAIGLDQNAFPLADPELKHAYPPVAYIHFADDSNIAQKVEAMLKLSQEKGVPAAEVKVAMAALAADFFSRRDPMVSKELSRQLFDALERLGALDADNILKDDWDVRGDPAPWDKLLREDLAGMVAGVRREQLALKAGSPLALAQRALDAAGEAPLTIQEISADDNAAADESANQADTSMTSIDSNGTLPAGGGEDPYLAAGLLYQHLQEEMAVAWAHHTNLGDYATAALMWLERCGRASFANLAEAKRVAAPAELSPLRAVGAEQVLPVWRACSAGGSDAELVEALQQADGGVEGGDDASEDASSAAWQRSAGMAALASVVSLLALWLL